MSFDQGQTYEWKRSGLRPWHDGIWGEHYIMQIEAKNNRAYATTLAGLLISSDNGHSWRMLDNEFSGQGSLETGRGNKPPAHLHGLAIDPDNTDVVYVGTGIGSAGFDRDIFDGSFIWKSRDGGDSWREITNGFPSGKDTVIHDILVSSANSDHVYLATRNRGAGTAIGSSSGLGLYHSSNGGNQWQQLETPFSNIYALAQDATNPNTLYVSVSPKFNENSSDSAGIYKTHNGGKDWERVLSYPTKALATHPKKSGLVFAGTKIDTDYWDVLVSEDAGQTWVKGDLTIQIGTEATGRRDYDGVARHSDYWSVELGDIKWFAIDGFDSLLYAATNGAGLWRSDIRDIE